MLPQDFGALTPWSQHSCLFLKNPRLVPFTHLSQPEKSLKAKAKWLGSLYSVGMNLYQVDQGLNGQQIASLVC